VSRGGLAAIKVDVLTPDSPAAATPTTAAEHAHDAHAHEAQPHPHKHAPHRPLSAIVEIIRSAPLAEAVKARAIRAFQLLGEAEAPFTPFPSRRAFSRSRPVDTIVDIVCAAAGCERSAWSAGFALR